METNILKTSSDYPKYQCILSNPLRLKELVREMEEALLKCTCINYNSPQRFSCVYNSKHNPFGYKIKKREILTNKESYYRSNSLRYKLIRIQKEFQFVKANLRNYHSLTAREREIVQLLAMGYNNPEIANRLFISRRTVEQHHKHINYKLHIKSLPHLVQYAYAFNLI